MDITIGDMALIKLQAEIWKVAEEKGWHDGPCLEFGEFLSPVVLQH